MSVSAGSVVGGVLCGGRSRRMGRPKESLDYGGRTFLDLAVARHGPGRVLVSGEAAHPAAETVPDLRPDAGPLGGLESMLAAADAEWLVVSPVDAPLLTAADLARLLDTRRSDEAVVARAGGRIHATVAAFHVETCRPAVVALLARGERRADAVVESIRCRLVDLDVERLVNVNTPVDFDRLPRSRS